MRYVSHVLRSPRVMLQLLLLLMLGGLIGGVGLHGLNRAHSTLHDIASAQLPGLVHLLDAEREITQAENLGYRALLNYDSANKKTPVEIPEIVALVRQSWRNYQQFESAGPHPRGQAALQSQIEARFPGLLLAAGLAEPIGSAQVGSTVGRALLQQADAQFVAPLQMALTQLAELDEADVTAGGVASAGSVADTAALLLGVILGTIAIVCVFQIVMEGRGHRSRVLSQQSADLVLIVDGQGIVRHASASFQQALGHSPSELVGHSLADIVHRDDLDEAAATLNHLATASGAKQSTALRALHANGSYHWLELAAVSQVRDPLVRSIVINARDVTERKEAELRLRAVLTHAPIALFAVEAGGTFTYYQEGAPFIASASAPTVVGTSIGSWQKDAPHLNEVWARILAGESFPIIVDTNDRVFEVWWTADSDTAGIGAGTGVAVDVTATVRAGREAESARLAALELARTRSDFVAAVSHELRTPLTAIIGYSELLEERWQHLDDAQRRTRITFIVQAANRQLRLVEDLLLTTRLDSDMALLQPTSCSVAALLASVTDELEGKYTNQRFDLEGPANLRMLADGGAAKQVLINLLDNAAKYSAEGCPVAVDWRQDGETVAIRVHDQGSGIAEEHRSLLFTRFGRIQGSRIRSGHVGTGLGLFLGRRLARAMGGDLELESTGPAGSVFRLSLPLDSPPEQHIVGKGPVVPPSP